MTPSPRHAAAPRPASRWPRRLLLAALTLLVLTAAAALAWQLYRGSVGAPGPQALEDRWHRGHRFLARDGRLLREKRSQLGLRGRESDLEQIGHRLIHATIAAEDQSFLEHDGVDRLAMLRALGQAIRHRRRVSGASTITQQLVKLLDGRGDPPARDLALKLREAARAMNLEAALSKPEILAAYLNRLPYGHGLVGPEAAALAYFGVAPADLSWAQAAFLAVLPRAPSYLDPYTHQERVLPRQRRVLEGLVKQGHLSDADRRRAESEPILLRPLTSPFFAPHLVESIIAAEDRLYFDKKTTTHTTLDLDLQRDLEGLTRGHLAHVAEQGATDAAVLVVDNRSGELLAYVGSADFHDPAISGQVDMIRARRQPGSTLKPFVYALAFARGHSGAEATADVATRFQEAGGTYTPLNFSRSFEGPIPLREALAGSLNIPAVRLAAELEDGVLLDLLHQLGFASLTEDPGHYGLALALGGGEVRLRELAAAYVALARGGESIPLRDRLRDGEPPESLGRELPRGTGAPIFAPAVAAAVTEALSDPLARIRGLHGRGPFALPYPVAVKTGTSSGYRDTWAVGYTYERTVAVWLGNADGTGTAGLTGGSGAGPLFAAAMRRAMADVPTRAPLWQPGLLTSHDVCPLSGMRPGPACPDAVARLFAEHMNLPEETCTKHAHVRPDPSAPAGLRCDPRGRHVAVLLPDEYDEWLLSHGPRDPDQPWLLASATPGCAEARERPIPTLTLTAPTDGAVYLSDRRGLATFEVRVTTDALNTMNSNKSGALGELELVLDGHVVARAAHPYRALITAPPGDHTLLVRPADPTLEIHLASARFAVR